MIRDRNEMSTERTIDLSGPEGNAFCLLGYARRWGNQLGLDTEKVMTEMQSGDYDNLVNVFDSYFGDYVTLYR